MIRENRYLVLKLKDITAALTDDERDWLGYFAHKIYAYRFGMGKKPLECVVVESDWPEYEDTWSAIEDRVEGENMSEEIKTPSLPPEGHPLRRLGQRLADLLDSDHLAEEAKRLARDAERYRWLRSHSFVDKDQIVYRDQIIFGPGYEQTAPEILDARIDKEVNKCEKPIKPEPLTKRTMSG